MSETAVLERPTAAIEDTPRFLRVSSNLRRLWRVWSILDDAKSDYSAHGAYGWRDIPQTRIAVVEVNGSPQEVARIISEFERYRFKALPFVSLKDALTTPLGTALPVDDERGAAEAEAEKSHQKGLLKPRRPGTDDKDDGLAGV